MRPTFSPERVNQPFGEPGLYVDYTFEKQALLFDLGDLTALPPKKLLRISEVFVSHAHTVHFFGFDRLLRICLGRNRAMRFYGPPGFSAQVGHKLAAYNWKNRLVERGMPVGPRLKEVKDAVMQGAPDDTPVRAFWR
jgi:ribonuclease Z